MVEFSKEKEECLLEKAKELQKKGYNWGQISKTFGVAEEWFTSRFDKDPEPKFNPKNKIKKRS